ncbi:hypothetical protein T484DRAFT_1750529 [Baffinella frigidus]|nr:hypothetical protein T484DRAFT_1750529 [Cryptophyta sp. CCMP2293]
MTQSVKGIAENFNDTPDLSIPVQVVWEEKTETDNRLLPVSDQVLFSVQFLPYLDQMITQLIALIQLANDYNQRNLEANTDVDTLKTTLLRLIFLSQAQQHMMCAKAVSNNDTKGTSFASNSLKMRKFREQFLERFPEEVVVAENAGKGASGQATTYVGGDVNMKTFHKTLDELTESTNYLKSSKYYQDAKPGDTLDAHKWWILTTTITSVEKITSQTNLHGPKRYCKRLQISSPARRR